MQIKGQSRAFCHCQCSKRQNCKCRIFTSDKEKGLKRKKNSKINMKGLLNRAGHKKDVNKKKYKKIKKKLLIKIYKKQIKCL